MLAFIEQGAAELPLAAPEAHVLDGGAAGAAAPAAAPPVVAGEVVGVAAAGAPPAPQRRRGRPPGIGWTAQHRDRVMRKKAENKAAAQEKLRVEQMQLITGGGRDALRDKAGRRRAVSQLVFGTGSITRRGGDNRCDTRLQTTGEINADGSLTTLPYVRTRKMGLRRLRLRGAVSYANAVRSRLPSMLRNKNVLITSSVYDEANHWVRRISEGGQKLTRPGKKKFKTPRGVEGRNVHMPVLNSVDHWLARPDVPQMQKQSDN